MKSAQILKGGRVVDPANGVDEVRDIAVDGGVIVAPDALGADAEVVDMTGLTIVPGLIDIHVHLRDPGQTQKEDIATGTSAAARGGFTSILAMPNTRPPIDSRMRLEEVNARIQRHAMVRVLQAASLTVGSKGEMLSDAHEMRDAGAAALTDDGGCIQSSALMLAAMRQAVEAGLPVVDHAEDLEVAAGGVLHDGRVAHELGLKGKSRSSEELIVARDIVLARETGCPVHIQHVSSAGTVELIRIARRWGLPVTGEATPHHLALTEDACLQYGTNAKMNPPLRTEEDRDAIVAGVIDGTLTVIATDHAPHTAEEKANGFESAPFGIIGLETAVAICLTELHHGRGMELVDLTRRFTQGPREALGLAAGTLSAGVRADITVLDVDAEHVIDASAFASKSRNCPYHGWKCKGLVRRTMVDGHWVFINKTNKLEK